ncbi:hypothetical protein KP509_09G002900 [Ceratopteris richardii]|nr:hypothetical protein KP509_09G002900 [Ceratopteris richardii]
MYGKCNDIIEAEKVFHKLPMLTVVSWNSMMSAYLDDGRAETALQLYSEMHTQGLVSDLATSILAIQACTALMEHNFSSKSRESIVFTPLEIGEALHADLRRTGLASQMFVTSALVSLYGKCKAISKAENAFCSLSHHDVVSWNVILASYVEHGQGQKALQSYVWMQSSGMVPDRMSVMIALQACSLLAEKDERYLVDGSDLGVIPLLIGQALHNDSELLGVALDSFVANTLVSMYGKCGAVKEAEQIFCTAFNCDAVAWNAMASTYVEQGEAEKALQLYSQMLHDGVTPDQLTFVIAIQACAALAETCEPLLHGGRSLKLGPFEIGKGLHADARRQGFELDALVGCTLVTMYGKCGATSEAEHIFILLPSRDVIAWNAMLSSYVSQGDGYVILQAYVHMHRDHMSPDQMTLVAAVQACSLIVEKEQYTERDSSRAISLEIGKTLHSEACKKGFLFFDFVQNTLINMYGKCGAIKEAEHLFYAMPIRTIVSWNAILSGYVEQGYGERALELYTQMQSNGLCADQLTCVIALQACTTLLEKGSATEHKLIRKFALDSGHMLHVDTIKRGFASDVIVANTLVNMYGKSGNCAEAMHVFDVMPERTTASWNVMLLAYVEQEHGEEALELYKYMRNNRLLLDHITPICVLQACALVGSLRTCQHIHFDIVSAGYDCFPSLNSPLIDAYGSGACMEDALDYFSTLIKPEITAWNACIAGYTDEGDYVKSTLMFEELRLTGLNPDEVTFSSVLSACNHSGLPSESVGYTESLQKDHSLVLDLMHYGSMLDLLGRAGDFKRIESMLSSMHIPPDLGIWLCLLAACCTHGNLELARLAFDHAVSLEPKQITLYILMSNALANVVCLEELGNDEEDNRVNSYFYRNWENLSVRALLGLKNSYYF